MKWETKSGIRITGKPETKSYYMLLRDKKGFEKMVKKIGFVFEWNIADYVPSSMWPDIKHGEITPPIPNSNQIKFYFKEWRNNSVALYNEYS